jgi:hypothetical protein
LRPIAEIEVFGQGIPLPAAGILNAGATPQASSPIEVEEKAVLGANGLLDDEMAINAHGFRPGQRVVLLVGVSPARLQAAQVWVLKGRNGPLEPIRFGDEVSVENRDQLTGGGLGVRFAAPAL